MRLPNFIGGTTQSLSSIADCARTVNWYVEPLAETGKNQAALYPTPGQSLSVTLPDVGARAMLMADGAPYAVYGANLYALNRFDLNPTSGYQSYTGMTQDSNPAQIAYNGRAGNRLAIASGGNLYYFPTPAAATTNVITQVSGISAFQVGMIDGYFVAFDKTNARIQLSPLNDTTATWDATQYAQRSVAPDPWQAMLCADRLGAREVWLIGSQTGEVWYDAGTFPFPLAPIPGAIFPYGIIAPWSLQAAGSTVLWLTGTQSGGGQVVAAQGYAPRVISTPAVDNAIAGYARTAMITDAEALTITFQGHLWYVLRFPAANATWVYDLTTQTWFEWLTWNSAAERFDALNIRAHLFTGTQHWVGTSSTTTVNILDTSYGTEADGSAIRRVRVYPGIWNEGRQFTYRRHEVKLEPGLGLATGQGSAPLVMLRTSDNGGKTWSRERTASAGAIGQYDARVFWTRLGTARDRVFELSVSDPIPYRLIDAYVNNDTRQAA